MNTKTARYAMLKLIRDLGGEATRDQIKENWPTYWELSEEDKENEK